MNLVCYLLYDPKNIIVVPVNSGDITSTVTAIATALIAFAAFWISARQFYYQKKQTELQEELIVDYQINSWELLSDPMNLQLVNGSRSSLRIVSIEITDKELKEKKDYNEHISSYFEKCSYKYRTHLVKKDAVFLPQSSFVLVAPITDFKDNEEKNLVYEDFKIAVNKFDLEVTFLDYFRKERTISFSFS